AADAAVERLPESAAMRHGRAVVRHARGEAEERSGDLREALRIARAGAEAHPEDLARRLELVVYLVALDQAAEARTVFDGLRESLDTHALEVLRERLQEQASALGESAALQAVLERLR
ncbi:MAG TPA: hypothetical protein RMG45_22115, partial [Polyangiaceae bacterium LLY-WYZ-15_(1-7)]|nr:hypothetical protein [Polyangiaceae bacterium LLY-WYZ-15_(1-7)]